MGIPELLTSPQPFGLRHGELLQGHGTVPGAAGAAALSGLSHGAGSSLAWPCYYSAPQRWAGDFSGLHRLQRRTAPPRREDNSWIRQFGPHPRICWPAGNCWTFPSVTSGIAVILRVRATPLVSFAWRTVVVVLTTVTAALSWFGVLWCRGRRSTARPAPPAPLAQG